MTEDRGILLRQAAEFLVLQEGGSRPEFPQSLTEKLLSSQYGDNWRGGLYLASRLPRQEIMERFFAQRSTFPALAVFLAAGIAAHREPRGSALLNHTLAIPYLTERWRVPDELRELTLTEFKAIATLLRYAGEAGEHYAAAERPKSADQPKLAIIVHGTWATKETWWRPKGSLWNHVHAFWPHLYGGPSPFAWSGKNDHAERVIAAQQLVAWAQAEGAASLDVIAHSHGGNVCLLAARLGLSISRLILLGTPIRTEYMLDLKNTGSIANVFSLADLTQTPLGTAPHRRFEGRSLGDSASVSNWRAEDDGSGSEPGHSDLHEPPTWKASGLNALLI